MASSRPRQLLHSILGPARLALLRPLSGLAMLSVLVGCGGPEAPTLPTTDGRPVTVPLASTLQVRVAVPKGCKVLDGSLWACQHGPDRVALLRVARQQEPDEGTDAYLDKLVRDLGKNGQAGVERDERVALGDLEARRIDAVALREKPATAIWLLAAAAEDGLYTASVAGAAGDLREKAKEYEAFLLSLRITTASGATPRQGGSADLLPEDEVEPKPEAETVAEPAPDAAPAPEPEPAPEPGPAPAPESETEP